MESWLWSAGGAGMLVAAWLLPEGLMVVAALLAAAMAWFSRRLRVSLGWRETAWVLAVPVGLLAKDLLSSGPLGRAAVEAGLVSGWAQRQPDVFAAARAAAMAGIALACFQALRVLGRGERAAPGWCRGVALAAGGLAAVLLTAPEAMSSYGESLRIGAVASRNAAAGVFALASFAAFEWGRWASREGRTWEWACGAVCLGLCVTAVSGLGSRGGLLALVTGAAYLLVRRVGGRGRWLALATGGSVVAVLVLAPATVARFAGLGEEYRLELWTAGARAWWQAPWGGVGGGGFPEAFGLFGGLTPTRGARALHPDSSWVLLWVEWGVVAAGALVAAFVGLWRVRERGDGGRLRATAEAAVIAWGVAAIGDIAFHRTELLVLGLPFLALARPLEREEARRGARGGSMVVGAFALVFAGALVVASVGAERVDRMGEAGLRLKPWSQRLNHGLGFEAVAKTDWERAAKHFRAVVAVDPANVDALRLYAGALTPNAPRVALEFWDRLFRRAQDRAHGFLTDSLRAYPDVDRVYWMRALEGRPDLWVVLADADDGGAQTVFEQWRSSPAQETRESPATQVLSAMARWGTAGDLRRWLGAASRFSSEEIASGGRFLRERRRDDLAWVWLAHHLPEATESAVAEPEPGLRARVLANPDDFVAAARLVRQTAEVSEKLRLLETLIARKSAPPALRVQAAHLLKREGRDGDALEHLWLAAEAIAATRAN